MSRKKFASERTAIFVRQHAKFKDFKNILLSSDSKPAILNLNSFFYIYTYDLLIKIIEFLALRETNR